MPPLPDPHAIAVLVLVVVAFYLFTREKISLETSSLLILIALVVGFEVFPYHRAGRELHTTEFFSGFGHEALITICALMIVGKGMETTGALRPLAALLARMWAASPLLSFLATLVLGAVCSAFLNNTPIVVMLLPILIGSRCAPSSPPRASSCRWASPPCSAAWPPPSVPRPTCSWSPSRRTWACASSACLTSPGR